MFSCTVVVVVGQGGFHCWDRVKIQLFWREMRDFCHVTLAACLVVSTVSVRQANPVIFGRRERAASGGSRAHGDSEAQRDRLHVVPHGEHSEDPCVDWVL